MPDNRSNLLPILRSAAISLISLALFLATAQIASAQAYPASTFSVLHNFTGGLDGANPEAGLTLDKAGNLYGTAFNGGLGFGTAFRLTKRNGSWIFAPLYSFTGTDGDGPAGRISIAPDGSLYGTTSFGGTRACTSGQYVGCGTVFHLRPQPTFPKTPLSPWTENVLYNFTGGSDGRYPQGDLALDASGNIYGTTLNGGIGSGGGVVYMLTHGSWTESVLYPFNPDGSGGISPRGGVIFGSDGNLYGTTQMGGNQRLFGVVFELAHSGSGWNESVLYNFQGGSDGSMPYGGVIFDAAGNIYGTTTGTPTLDDGTLFELSPSGGSWTLKTLCAFPGGLAAQGPVGSLVMDAAGNLYGATAADGLYGYGSVFKASQSGGVWTCTTLHDFTGGMDGGNPFDGLALDANGNLYGTAFTGGTGSACSHGCGVVFEITPH